MEKKLILNYKSGKVTELRTEMTAEEMREKIKNNIVDINPNDLTMIRWGEVESISRVE